MKRPTREDLAALLCGVILAAAIVAGTMDFARAASSRDESVANTVAVPDTARPRLACPVGGCTDYLIATRGDTTWYERQCILPPSAVTVPTERP